MFRTATEAFELSHLYFPLPIIHLPLSKLYHECRLFLRIDKRKTSIIVLNKEMPLLFWHLRDFRLATAASVSSSVVLRTMSTITITIGVVGRHRISFGDVCDVEFRKFLASIVRSRSTGQVGLNRGQPIDLALKQMEYVPLGILEIEEHYSAMQIAGIGIFRVDDADRDCSDRHTNRPARQSTCNSDSFAP